MNDRNQHIQNLTILSPQLKTVLTQSQYDIFQDFVLYIGDETSWRERYEQIYGRIDELLKHTYLKNPCYQDLKVSIYKILQPFSFRSLYDASLSKIDSYIAMMDQYNTYYIEIITDIEDYQRINRNSEINQIHDFFETLTNLLKLYNDYRDEYYERDIDEHIQQILQKKTHQLLNNISKYTVMNA